jgi:hypothetical protein
MLDQTSTAVDPNDSVDTAQPTQKQEAPPRPPAREGESKCRRCRGGKETFHYLYGRYLYDVDRARAIAADGREAVEVEEESARASVEESELDVRHVDHVNPTIPGVIAHIHYRLDDGEVVKAYVLIDGHHRAARCLRDGVPFLAYLLTEEESKAILLRGAELSSAEPALEGACGL